MHIAQNRAYAMTHIAFVLIVYNVILVLARAATFDYMS